MASYFSDEFDLNFICFSNSPGFYVYIHMHIENIAEEIAAVEMGGPSVEKILSQLELILRQLRLLIKRVFFLKTTTATCYEVG